MTGKETYCNDRRVDLLQQQVRGLTAMAGEGTYCNDRGDGDVLTRP